MDIEPPSNSSLLSKIQESFYTCIESDYKYCNKINPMIMNSLLTATLMSPPLFYEKILSLKKFRKEVCSAGINHGELSFKCYDCGRDNEFHILCEYCFMNGFHEGHRMMYSTERGGCCDCGDSGAIDEIGFCKHHKGYAGIDKNIVLNIPQEITNGLEALITWIFVFIINEFDRIEKMPPENEKEKAEKLEKINVFNQIFFEFLSELCNDNICMTFLISNFFMKKINENDEKNNLISPVFKFYHKCEDLDKLRMYDTTFICSCSFLDLIFRYNLLFPIKTQDFLEKFIFSLFANFEFKKYLVFTYSKMMNFLLGILNDNGKIIFIVSRLRSLYTQFFSHELMDIFFENNFLEIAYEKIDGLLDLMSDKEFEKIYDKFLDFYNILFFVNERKISMERKILNSDIFYKYMRLILKKREFKFVSIEQQRMLIHIQKFSLKLFEDYLLHYYNNLKLEDYNNKIIEILNVFIKEFDVFYFTDEEFQNIVKSNNILFIHEYAVKAYGLLMAYCLAANKNLNKFKELMNFHKNHKILEFLFVRNMKIMLLYHEFMVKKPDELANKQDFYEKKKLLKFYYYGQITNLIDYHISSLQIYANIMDIFTFSTVLIKSFDFTKDFNHLIEFLLMLITNENSFLNSTVLLTIKESNDFRSDILKSMISNFFVMFPKINYKDLKFKINRYILNKSIEIKDDLLKVAELNNETKEFKLKKPIEQIYEPYFWVQIPEIGSKYFEIIRDLCKKNDKIDLLLGSPKKYDLNPLILSLLETIKGMNIIEEQLIIHFLQEDHIDNIRNYLKMLYLLLEYQTDNGVIETSIVKLIEKYEKDILSKLENFRMDKNFEELTNSFTFMKRLLTKISQNSNLSMLSYENNEKQSEKLKREAQKQKLLKQFANFQQNFIQKNQDLLDETTNLTNTTVINECFICHEQNNINTIEMFGMSAYVTLDALHNFYYHEWDHSPLVNPDNYRYFSQNRHLILSCNHQAHKKCLSSYLANRSNNTEHSLLINSYYKCFCKFSCNLSIPIIIQYVQPKINKNLNLTDEKFFEIDNIKKKIISLYFDQNDYCKAFEDAVDHLIVKGALDEFINKLMISVLNFNEDTHEYYIFDILLESLIFFSEESFCEGIEYFIKKRFLLTKNLFLILQYVFWTNNDSITFQGYLAKYKENLMKDINKLIVFDKNDVTFLRNLDIFFSRIIWKTAILFLFDEDDKKSLIFSISKLFINKLIVLFSFKFLTETNELKTMKNLLDSLENYDFRIKVLSFLMPYFHLISGLLFIIFNYQQQSIEHDFNDSSEINQQLLYYSSFFGNLFNLDLTIIHKYGQTWIDSLNFLPETSKQIISLDVFKNPCLKFSLPSIDINFLTFYSKYITRKCIICKGYPRNRGSDLYFCLICEEILCSGKCIVKSEENNENKIGNLTKHAKHTHAGKTIYINLLDSKILWLDVPTISIDNYLFSDSLGQNMNKKCLNWGDYYLNKGKFEKLRSLIVKRELTQEVYYQVLKNPKEIGITDQI